MTERTRQERANGRRYTLQIAGASALYLVLIAVPPIFFEQGTALGTFTALLPILPVVWMFFAVLQFVRGLDEYYRPRMISSMAIGFAASILCSAVIGMIENSIGMIPFSSWIIFVAGMSAWGLALGVISARAAR